MFKISGLLWEKKKKHIMLLCMFMSLVRRPLIVNSYVLLTLKNHENKTQRT
jgi:hypothetical protein